MCVFGKNVFSKLTAKFNDKRHFCGVVKSFNDIPGPPSLPFVGTLYLYVPFLGRYSFDRLHRNGLKNVQSYGPIIKEEIFPGHTIVWLSDPNDMETVFRMEGQYPERLSHLALEKYRLDKPDIYNTGGLLPTNGPEWSRLRKVFQKGLTSPQDAVNFIDGSDRIISEWLDDRIDRLWKQHDVDYQDELSRVFLELLGFAAFDTRFMSFDPNEFHSNSRSTRLLRAALDTNDAILKLDNGPRLWKKFRTPLYRKLCAAQEYMESVATTLVIDKMTKFPEKESSAPTLLERYLSSPVLDFRDIIGISCDFLLAGMDTTTYTTCFLLYHLARNPQTQHSLYQESCDLLQNPRSCVDGNIYRNAVYAKSALKESLRMNPISLGVGRLLSKDAVLSGYSVPAKTLVVTLNQVSCRLDTYFSNPNSYQPERWLNKQEKPHSFLVAPFGYGQRSCIARRFAEQNIILLILKLIRRYKLSWIGEEIDSKSQLINRPDGPIALKIEPRD